LLLAAGGQVRPLEPEEHALPLGLSFLDGGPPPVQTIELPPEAILLMYTDGVTEARDEQDRFYDPADRLTGVAFTGPDELLDWLLTDLGRHSGAGADDIALLAACRDREGLRSVTGGRPSA
jgi:serine phosphatase RsbU (regulator of sigma subunit)